MTDKVRLMSPPPRAKKLAMKHRISFLLVTALVTVVAIVSCIAFATPTQHRNSALTHKEYAFARELVQSESRRDGAVLTSATVTVGSGRVIDSNIGYYPCPAGRLLQIKLIGDFSHIAISPIPVKPGAPHPDTTVHAVNLTADAETRRICLIGVQTGVAAPESGAESLPIK